MSVNEHGFDPERNRWSIETAELLFPPIAKQIYKAEQIIYAWNCEGIDRLDKHYGVDSIITSVRQRNAAIAIRVRGYHYWQEFGDVTIRYDSLQTLGKMLEMQKSIARFLFYAWADTDRPMPASDFVDWHSILLQRLVDQFMLDRIDYKGPFENVDESSRLVAFNIATLRRMGLLHASKER